MKVLLIGSGGREHALALALAKSPLLSKLFVAPGNPGMAKVADLVALDVANHAAVVAFCKLMDIRLVVVGPEAPLVAGLVDDLEAAGIRAFGPTKAAAQLEGSKGFTKDLCRDFAIPTGAYRRFTAAAPALAYVRERGAPIVVKADGLAAGKGVVVAMTDEEAEAAVRMMFGGAFGAAGAEVVIEEFLDGEEASFFAICDGARALPFASAQDHKRVGDGDTGANTGGMGAYSPAPVVTAAVHERVMREVIEPTVRGMAAEGHPYSGFLYAGLMIDASGAPKVIEFNCRFGDPETQPVMMRLQASLPQLVEQALAGALAQAQAAWDSRPALGVVLAAANYPGDVAKGAVIRGLGHTSVDAKIFHAGTAVKNGEVVTNGGRVLCATALGETVAAAQQAAYQLADAVQWDGMFMRRDIGWRAVERERKT